jgi:hypothetical protein
VAESVLACAYVDRRGLGCGTAWCSDHHLVVEDRAYCRRHAGVVSAMPGGDIRGSAPLPDVENRSPSLVSWVAREVDADIRYLLAAELIQGGAAELVADPVHPIFTGSDRRRAWERAWKLVAHAAPSLRVSLIVEECADAEVAVAVNATVVDRLTPPWILQRLHGGVSPEVDAQRRKEFNRVLLGTVRRGIDRERRSHLS